jgi:hypothetical protein
MALSGRYALAALVAAFIFAGCGGPQGGANVTSAIPPAMVKPLIFDPKCHGTGIHVHPCPITLDSASGVEVDIVGQRGEHLTKAWVFKPCGSICVPQRIDNFHFQITPGTECGKKRMAFRAYRNTDHPTGLAYLTVKNEVCQPNS